MIKLFMLFIECIMVIFFIMFVLYMILTTLEQAVDNQKAAYENRDTSKTG